MTVPLYNVRLLRSSGKSPMLTPSADRDRAAEDPRLHRRPRTADDRHRLHRRQLGRLRLPIPRRQPGLAALAQSAARPRVPAPRRHPVPAELAGAPPAAFLCLSALTGTDVDVQRWLLEQGRDDEARAVVLRLHGGATPEARVEADAEFVEMHAVIKAEASSRSRNLSDLWETRAMLRRTLVAVGVQVFGQFSGINGAWPVLTGAECVLKAIAVINYFGPSMYQALGLSPGQSLLVQGIYGAVGPITNFLCVSPFTAVIPVSRVSPSFITLILDTVGRKKPLMFGAASFVVTYSILTAIVASFPPVVDGVANTHHSAQRAGIAMIFMTSIFFSVSFGPVSWVLASEVSLGIFGVCVTESHHCRPCRSSLPGLGPSALPVRLLYLRIITASNALAFFRSGNLRQLGVQHPILAGLQSGHQQRQLAVLSSVHLPERH